MTGSELRSKFLSFFESKDHKILPSASLVPDDPTTLLTSAGMQPFVPYFKGEATPPHPRLATSQKSLRIDDIEEVGRTWRHGTFFEMLGNFSFGDYFKKEAIEWAWEFVTQVLNIPRDVLWISVYLDDDEAFDCWHRNVGLPTDRILRMGKKDNWWGPVGISGPCGPDSEIFYDRGESFGCGRTDCKPGCDCDRYGELWNLVFQQFDQQPDGSLSRLPKSGIDTGMGLERVAAVLQGKRTIFESDLFEPVLNFLVAMANEHSASSLAYGQNESTDIALRIIAEHTRAVTFLAAEGIMPSNEGRGYVFRRLLRRAFRYGRDLGLTGSFLHRLPPLFGEIMGEAYPEVVQHQEAIAQVLRIEEERFQDTLAQGINLLEATLGQLAATGATVVPGDQVFRLYDTFGFPPDLTEEIVRERGWAIDRAGFEERMEQQRAQARQAGAASFAEEARGTGLPKSEFVGYKKTTGRGSVTYISDDGLQVVLDQTPFYGEAGGQVGDTGELRVGRAVARVVNTTRQGDAIVHHLSAPCSKLKVRTKVKAVVDAARRAAVRRAHTATHLLHCALRAELGDHATQSGSLVEPDRLRFDFAHFSAVSGQELAGLERAVNVLVRENLPVTTAVRGLEEARRAGATALFGEKYGEVVRVVSVADVSKELCGGTHAAQTGEIGLVRLVSEGSVGANLRRIEALTGELAVRRVQEEDERVRAIAAKLNATPATLADAVEKLTQSHRDLEKRVEALEQQSAARRSGSLAEAATEVEGVAVVAARVDGLSVEALRTMGDQACAKLGTAVVVLGAEVEGRVLFIAKAANEAVARGVHAGNLVREVARRTGGGGGGRPDFAQAGGRDPSKLAEALNLVTDLVRSQLQAAA